MGMEVHEFGLLNGMFPSCFSLLNQNIVHIMEKKEKQVTENFVFQVKDSLTFTEKRNIWESFWVQETTEGVKYVCLVGVPPEKKTQFSDIFFIKNLFVLVFLYFVSSFLSYLKRDTVHCTVRS